MERRLDRLNHQELRRLVPERIDAVILPVGTIEAHGIIPLGTDLLIPEAMAARIGEEVDALVAPAIPYGITRGLVGYPGTVCIRSEVFQAYVSDVVESLADAGFRKIIVLNGHGGQIDELKAALFETGKVCRVKTLLINWWVDTEEIRAKTLKREGGHAGSDETAAIMAIDAALVRPELYDPELEMRYSSSFSAYPFPGTIITYSDGDNSLNLDEGACKAYFDAVTAKVAATIRTITTKWSQLR
jgi:creatinine amidohydrolase